MFRLRKSRELLQNRLLRPKISHGDKKPHFFCESCGAEVPKYAKNCPSCGSAFASVRCPACDFSGEESLFNNGCPSCGYSSKKEERESENYLPDLPAEGKKPAGALSVWVYVLTAAVFTAILAALFLTLFPY